MVLEDSTSRVWWSCQWTYVSFGCVTTGGPLWRKRVVREIPQSQSLLHYPALLTRSEACMGSVRQPTSTYSFAHVHYWIMINVRLLIFLRQNIPLSGCILSSGWFSGSGTSVLVDILNSLWEACRIESSRMRPARKKCTCKLQIFPHQLCQQGEFGLQMT